MPSLVFIDTNIFLDFYRVRGREKGLSILNHIDGNHSSFITSSQVEMEYKKHRQSVILECLKQIKAPNFESLASLPAFLSQSKQSSALATSTKRIGTIAKQLQARIGRVLQKPTNHDQVYKVCQRLFKSETPYNLNRDKDERFKIRNLARKRFALGYPPRKSADTSIGDAVNWEWIVDCAIRSGSDVVIVSRDTDYGRTFNGQPILNDWLSQEFHERVSKKRKVVLTDRLSDGLREAGIGVTQQEADAEIAFLGERAQVRKWYRGWVEEDGARYHHDLGEISEDEAKDLCDLLGLTLERV